MRGKVWLKDRRGWINHDLEDNRKGGWPMHQKVHKGFGVSEEDAEEYIDWGGWINGTTEGQGPGMWQMEGTADGEAGTDWACGGSASLGSDKGQIMTKHTHKTKKLFTATSPGFPPKFLAYFFFFLPFSLAIQAQHYGRRNDLAPVHCTDVAAKISGPLRPNRRMRTLWKILIAAR